MVTIVVAVCTAVQWVYLKDRLTICSDSGTNTEESRLYWDNGDGFSEDRSRGLERVDLLEGYRCGSLSDIEQVDRVRIDPIARKGEFQLTELVVDRPTAIVLMPLKAMGMWRDRIDLLPRNALVAHDIQKKNGGYYSLSIDPYLIWNLNYRQTMLRPLVYGALDLLLCYLILYFGSRTLKKYAPARRSEDKGGEPLWMWGLYPAFLGFGIVIPGGPGILIYGQWMILALTLAYVGSRSSYFDAIAQRVSMRDVAILLVLGGGVSLDLIGHVARHGHSMFGSRGEAKYYWSLDRTISDNLDNASYRYAADIKKLTELLESETMFLSDRATSYYLSASLPVYGANVHPHHQIHNDQGYTPFFTPEFEGSLCTETGLAGMKEKMERKAEALRRFDWYPLKYLIVNVDTRNHNVKGNCLAAKRRIIVDLLAGNIDLIYEGEYLIVYELSNLETLK